MTVLLGGVFMSLHRMLMGGLMIAIRMVLGCRVVRLRCLLVVPPQPFLCASCAIDHLV
jgi:hypothetical protein